MLPREGGGGGDDLPSLSHHQSSPCCNLSTGRVNGTNCRAKEIPVCLGLLLQGQSEGSVGKCLFAGAPALSCFWDASLEDCRGGEGLLMLPHNIHEAPRLPGLLRCPLLVLLLLTLCRR